ncbi:hypothetical protein EAL2_c16640 [Peptoclostridium acidaminophilum DSM 3953]|uniref:Uncharacterized protein n=1 Tax=Peptoclostridium acidaminophilum DSM 3953 TaxID=1286171 RepID=W8T5C7_PEPAC|nr:hypothetical protein [Peptoclostridium acidaminophilum]AHM56959.1 hypothetical protein EAL2_c16640 [Peptoclostridium acidaminophilum DSM 3953]
MIGTILIGAAILIITIFLVLSIAGSFSFEKESEELSKAQSEFDNGYTDEAVKKYIRHLEKRRLLIPSEDEDKVREVCSAVMASDDISEELKTRLTNVVDRILDNCRVYVPSRSRRELRQ